MIGDTSELVFDDLLMELIAEGERSSRLGDSLDFNCDKELGNLEF